jgi:hypothetical protein
MGVPADEVLVSPAISDQISRADRPRTGERLSSPVAGSSRLTVPHGRYTGRWIERGPEVSGVAVERSECHAGHPAQRLG